MSARATSSQAPARPVLVLLSLIVVAGVAKLNLSGANVALPSVGKAFDSNKHREAELLAAYYPQDTGGAVVPAEPAVHPQS